MPHCYVILQGSVRLSGGREGVPSRVLQDGAFVGGGAWLPDALHPDTATADPSRIGIASTLESSSRALRRGGSRDTALSIERLLALTSRLTYSRLQSCLLQRRAD